MTTLRSEVRFAHQRLRAHWASPGATLTGIERLALVEQVRAARATPALAPWESATEVDATDSEVLEPALVDAVWRIAQSPSSLSEPWFRSVLDAGVSATTYVEMVSVVAMATMADRVNEAAGLPVAMLPKPLDGEPTGDFAGAEVSSHWVPTTNDEMSNVRAALSEIPAELEMQGLLLDTHYVPGGALGRDLTDSVWSLDRTQMELVATRTSTINECFY